MTMLKIAVIVGLIGLTLAQRDRALDTVTELDTAAYIGVWYQMYSNAYAYNGYEKDGLCHQATYGDNGDGTVSVWNTQRLYTADGPLDALKGKAYQRDAVNEPGKLMVSLDGVPFDFPYWIVKLGPKVINSDGVEVYDYAIITDSVSASLFVLARDPATYMQKYDQENVLWLTVNGFNKPFNSPIKSYQEDDCIYI
ncbi:uncharacterized protein [Ptychodera flava]|uniref:uncharacterized protein n=1 Tax=Ptychodera flava TaxID=63121 RepID=UPI003969D739